MSRWLLLLALLLAACIPAETPDNLRRTPNVLFRVTDGRYSGAAFSVQAPDGWRMITSPADAPESVIFAAPTDCAVIVVSTDASAQAPQIAPECGETRSETRTSGTLRLIGVAPASQWDNFAAQFETTAESIEAS